VGDRAEVAWPGGALLPATLAQIAEGADTATRTVEIELSLAGPLPAGLRSGFLVATTLLPQPVPARSVVPLAALVEGRGRLAHVFVVSADGRSVRRQEIEIAAIHAERAYLKTPLPAGTRVATTGAEFLTDGRSVTVAAPAP
jgi:multidrug efflux pump subunit AcrA (membrane-fusion protein)